MYIYQVLVRIYIAGIGEWEPLFDFPAKDMDAAKGYASIYQMIYRRGETLKVRRLGELAPGTPATLYYPSDRVPYVVTKISASGKTITLERLSESGIEFERQQNGGYPVHDHPFTAEEVADPARRTGEFITARYSNKTNRYSTPRGLTVTVGYARYYRDYND